MVDFWQAVEFSHLLLRKHIGVGATVIDATAGNGYDTVFLADLVGETGKVFSFDIQKIALENSIERLKKNNLIDRVELIEDGHQNFFKYITEKIDGMIFNLGYLPGGNKKITTKKDTTISAVQKGLNYLKPGGIMVLVVYTGHPGGKDELEGLLDFVVNLQEDCFNVLSYNFINQSTAPQVLAIIKRK